MNNDHQKMSEFIRLSYEYGQNPLPALRKRFPVVKWNFIDGVVEGAVDLESNPFPQDGETVFVTREGKLTYLPSKE